MKIDSSDKSRVIKFKIMKQDENPVLRTINILFILSYCILAIAGVYYFISTHSLKTVIFFVVLFFLLTFFMEILNEYLNIEYVEFKILNNSFILTKGVKVEKFDIKKCKIKYHEDKTDWLEIHCENQNFNFSLAQRQTQDLRNFIERNSLS